MLILPILGTLNNDVVCKAHILLGAYYIMHLGIIGLQKFQTQIPRTCIHLFA